MRSYIYRTPQKFRSTIKSIKSRDNLLLLLFYIVLCFYVKIVNSMPDGAINKYTDGTYPQHYHHREKTPQSRNSIYLLFFLWHSSTEKKNFSF